MAKIVLNIVTEAAKSKKEIDALKISIDAIAQSLSNVKVDKNLTAQINALTNHYKAVAAAAEKVQKVNYHNEIQEEKLAQAKAKTTKAIAEEMKATNRANEAFYRATKAKNDDARAQEKHTAQMKKAAAQAKKTAESTQKMADSTKTKSQNIISMIPNIMKWQVAMTAVMLPLRKMQEALESVNETLVETEKRVISLRRVAGDSANANELYKLAQQYGQTFENVAEVVELLVKSGYEWSEAIKAAEPALLAINVAELDATQATEGLIAVVKQYGMELEDLNYIQGVLNKTADNSAVTTEKLLLALQKTGSTADNANISFEETVGLITALSEGTAASGQNIGNALRSLIVFTKDDKALQTFASLSENMKSLVDDYKTGGGSIVDVWRGLGTELQKLENSGQTLRDIFGGTDLDSDIAAKLTEVEDQIAEVYGTAGNYRQNYFIALLKNLSTVEKVTKNLGDANTYSQKENIKYLESYEAKANKLKETWRELANDQHGLMMIKKLSADIATNFLQILIRSNRTAEALRNPNYKGNFLAYYETYADKAIEINPIIQSAASGPSIGPPEQPDNGALDRLKKYISEAESKVTKSGLPPENTIDLLNKYKNIVSLRKSELDILEAQGASEEEIRKKKKEIQYAINQQIKYLEKVGGQQLEINKLTAEWYKIENNLTDVVEETKVKYEDIVSSLEKIRDTQKESYEFEEKKKAVLEAEKALEEAQKNRLVQVYNAETGRFEFVANQKDIQNAKDDLDKARRDVENSAWDEVIKILKSEDGNLTKAKEVLEKWSGAYGTGSASFQNDMEEILYGSAFKTVQDFVTSHGIFASGASEPLETFIGMPGYEDLTDAFNALPDEWKKKITDKTGAKLYDHGGILHGLGGIKATTRPETVLDPEMTAKILEPTSNAQFASFARSMGLLFGASKSLASPSSPIIQRAISSDRHDRHYTVNGVPVSTHMADQYTIKELFELMPLV